MHPDPNVILQGFKMLAIGAMFVITASAPFIGIAFLVRQMKK